ncbi:DUF6959 family protein [Methylorubrum thiocyanatum]|uniref:DUF6959 family protein n=1 Tax=Methylorubrum thiocyanatum TaxID=47958 RepID=UPI003F804010
MSDQPFLLSKPQNFAVIQLPNRKYPGVVIQGDTLNELVKSLKRIETNAKNSEVGALLEEVGENIALLSGALQFYSEICDINKIKKPFTE